MYLCTEALRDQIQLGEPVSLLGYLQEHESADEGLGYGLSSPQGLVGGKLSPRVTI